MAQTVVGLNDPKAVRHYSSLLAVDVAKESYFQTKFMGKGQEAHTPIQLLTELENNAGDTITYDLVMQLRMAPTEGDRVIRGKEEPLKLFTDEVKLNQARHGVDTGGRMTKKRTIHDLRKISRSRSADWWARAFDELCFMYMSGARGVNSDYLFPLTYAGQEDDSGNVLNPFTAPDDMHHLFQGAGTKLGLTNADRFTLGMIDRSLARAKTMGGGINKIPKIAPCRIEGEDRYVQLLHPFQCHDLRTTTGATGWLEIQKSASGAEGRNSPIFKGGLGMYNNVILHESQNVIQFNDYGAGSDLTAARSLFMGRQALVVGFGSPGNGLRYEWIEETEDRGNKIVIVTGSILGFRKTGFVIDGVRRDMGVIANDTYISDPS